MSLQQFRLQWEAKRKEMYKAKQSELALKETLLVDGYIRNAQEKQLSAQIIPSSINPLCLQYLHVALPVLKETKIVAGTRRIFKEYRDIERAAPPNYSARPTMYDLFEWTALIIGPADSCYDGGLFRLCIQFPDQYPFKPPKVKFTTKIYHCNVEDEGKICVQILNEHDWSPACTVTHVLLHIRDLLQEPDVPDLVMRPDIAKLYQTNRTEHDRIAREWVMKYASEDEGASDL